MGNFNANVCGHIIDESLVSKKKFETKKNDFDVKNYLDTKLEDGVNERTVTVRILPVSNEDGNFRIAVKTHNLKVSRKIAASGFKSFLCLNDSQVPDYDPNVKCPICQKSAELMEEAKKCRETDPERSKTLYKKACSLRWKTTYIVRVIERGKENEGVKFWRFNENTQGNGIYDKLITLYKQRKAEYAEDKHEDNYNIFDLDRGHDIVLTLKRTVRADGEEGVSINITDKSLEKPLTNDIVQGNAWINDVKRWYHAYTVKSPEYLAIVADDKIPYFDRSQDKWVGKTEKDFIDAEQRKLEKKEEYNNVRQSASELLQYAMANSNDDNETDLPF